MKNSNHNELSKFLSLVLRHKPETIELQLDENGWAITAELIEKLNAKGFQITSDLLNDIVESNDKKRFSFNENKSLIRASQGHSVSVDLGLEVKEPPAFLYHGTGEKSIHSILATGLEKRKRQHVHLSMDEETAIKVGQRHGKPKVFIVDSKQMKADGFIFNLSDNNVWLTDHVPVKYLKLI